MSAYCGTWGQEKSGVPVIMAAALGWAELIASRRLTPVSPPFWPCIEVARNVSDSMERRGPCSAC